MLLDDDGDDDAPRSGAPLPPEDRLWRHPSEVAAALAPAAARDAPAPGSTRPWGVAAVSGVLGAVLAVGVVTVTVGLGAETRRTAIERVPSRPLSAALVSSGAPSDGADAVARALQPSVARITAGSTPTVGSAVVFRDDGYLLTTADLVGDASTVSVSLEGEELTGVVVGTDTLTDIAVLHIERAGLVPAVLDDGQRATVGQRTFVVAGTMSGTLRVTAGIIGAVGRQVVAADGSVLHGTVQTDAPVDSVALGGPLTDDRGVVLGLLATALSGGIGGNAVPIATALSVGEDIAEDGFARHVWLGIEGSDLDATRAAELHLTGGARVSHVNEQSPAAGCDLRDGDVITAVDGREVTSMSDLVVSLSAHRPGDTIVVEYWRDSELRTATATLVERSG